MNMTNSFGDGWRPCALSWFVGSNRAAMSDGQDLPENESDAAQRRRK
jgi:hypothetical protein